MRLGATVGFFKRAPELVANSDYLKLAFITHFDWEYPISFTGVLVWV